MVRPRAWGGLEVDDRRERHGPTGGKLGQDVMDPTDAGRGRWDDPS
jgi:hypothetical protein